MFCANGILDCGCSVRRAAVENQRRVAVVVEEIAAIAVVPVLVLVLEQTGHVTHSHSTSQAPLSDMPSSTSSRAATSARAKKTEVPISSSFSEFFNRLRTLAAGPQFYWYLTHVSTVSFTTLCIISSAIRGTSSSTTIYYYSLALSSILTTYLIILRQTYKHRSIAFFISQVWHLINHLLTSKQKRSADSHAEYELNNPGLGAGDHPSSKNKSVRRSRRSPVDTSNILRDENFQYLLFAFAHWLLASPKFGAINASVLYSFAIYAFFHSSTYFQRNILPTLPLVSADSKNMWKQRISGFHRIFNERSKMLASNTEVLLVSFYIIPLVKLFFKLLTARFWRSQDEFWYDVKIINLFIVTVTFLRARYKVDSHIRRQIDSYDSFFLRTISNPFVPPWAKQSLLILRKATGIFVEFLSVT